MDRDFPNRCDSGCRAFATQAVNPVLLQRKCACGQRSAEKECPECQSKNKPATAGINMAGNPQNYGHDFSRVHVRSEMEQGSSPSFASQRGMPRLESTSDKLQIHSCANDVSVVFKLTAADPKLAQKGKQEHCDDLTISFNQTLLPCSTELNKFAGTKIPGKSEDECFKSLKVKLGFDPGDCTLEFADLTKKDDERDSKGFHDFDPVLISKDCTKILSGVTPSATNKIGDPSVAPAKD